MNMCHRRMKNAVQEITVETGKLLVPSRSQGMKECPGRRAASSSRLLPSLSGMQRMRKTRAALKLALRRC